MNNLDGTNSVNLANVFDQRIAPQGVVTLPAFDRQKLRAPQAYIPDAPLIDAVRVALELRQPLLLTGDPGSGKTRLADFVAHRLGFGSPLTFRVKSTSVARDLFYVYDAIGRFNADKAVAANGLPFVKYGPLGTAILRANDSVNVQTVLTPGFAHPGNASASVVLIDEIDKAPRDFPNDFLGELEEMRFTIPEIGQNDDIKAQERFLPVVIITSNSERDLPDAFLRRCVYYHLKFPEPKVLEQIVLARLEGIVPVNPAFIKDALAVFMGIRKRSDLLGKPPGTSELIEWLVAMQRLGGSAMTTFDRKSPIVQQTLGTLFKTQNDLDLGGRLMGDPATS
jgi:MoxR-like ATPase